MSEKAIKIKPKVQVELLKNLVAIQEQILSSRDNVQVHVSTGIRDGVILLPGKIENCCGNFHSEAHDGRRTAEGS
jgi:hypothetical protein